TRHRPRQQDPRLPVAGRRRRYGGSQRTTRLQGRPAQLQIVPADAAASGYLDVAPDDEQSAQDHRAGTAGTESRRARASDRDAQPAQRTLSDNQGDQARPPVLTLSRVSTFNAIRGGQPGNPAAATIAAWPILPPLPRAGSC